MYSSSVQAVYLVALLVDVNLNVCHTCRTWKRMGDEGIEVADKIVMTSGLSSAFSWSDTNGLSREILHMISNTPDERIGKSSVTEVSPGSQKKITHYKVFSSMVNKVYEIFYLFSLASVGVLWVAVWSTTLI